MKIGVSKQNKTTKNMTNWIKIKNEWKEIVLSSTSHGLPNILRSDRLFFKVFWTFFILVCSSYCLYSIVKSIRSYYEYEVVTKIEVIDEKPTQFPAVTICNLNLLATDYAKQNFIDIITFSKDNNSDDPLKNLFKAKLTDLYVLEFLNSSFYSYFKAKYLIERTIFQFNSMSGNFTDENRRNYSLPFEDILMSCIFNGRPCESYAFDWLYHSKYGNCFTFNKDRNSDGNITEVETINKSGPDFGLKLEIFLGNINVVDKIIDSSGVHVFIHNQTDEPSSSSEGIDVSSGENTNFMIGRVFDSKLGQPYSNCRSELNSMDAFHSDFYKLTLLFYKKYTQKNCQDFCLNCQQVPVCGCRDPFSKISLDTKNRTWKNCSNWNEISCFMYLSNFMTSSIRDNIFLPQCPSECDKTMYTFSTSNSYYPNPLYAKFLRDQLNNVNDSEAINQDLLKDSFISINIYYDDLSYTKVSQIARMNFEDLMANV